MLLALSAAILIYASRLIYTVMSLWFKFPFPLLIKKCEYLFVVVVNHLDFLQVQLFRSFGSFSVE